jgi:Apea-like HEPN
VNDLLRRMDVFDQAVAFSEAHAFWDELAVGTETYEVGALIHLVAATLPEESVIIGPGIMLRRADVEWANSRFDGAENLPVRHCAITAEITAPRLAIRIFEPLAESERSRTEDLLLERGLLPLRLARPQAFASLGMKYRVGVQGYRYPTTKAFYGRFGLDSRNRERFATNFRVAEVSELRKLGKILAQMISRDDFAEQQFVDNTFELSLRAFSSIYARKQWQDRVVDIAQILEALFAGDGEELTHKSSMRAALLLGRSKQDSKRVFETTRRFYNFRSKVVHSDPGGVGTASRQVLEDWHQTSSRLPKNATAYVTPATYVGHLVVGTALRAFVYLAAEDGVDPFDRARTQSDPRFVDRLDLLAFSVQDRRKLQALARVRRRLPEWEAANVPKQKPIDGGPRQPKRR